MRVEVEAIHKSFGAFHAIEGVTFTVQSGELMALLGPSGSGKTTVLRIIAGLELPERGRVLFGGEDVTWRDVRARQVGFVFQNYALFEHLSVFENVAFGLRVRKMPKARVRERVGWLLELMRLGALGERLPAQLSGGQKQRVALARALAAEPKLLLLDEPFGALDARVRQQLRDWLRRIHGELGVTSLFVTHDQQEAFEIADRVVVMNAGRVEQLGTPQELWERPANAFVVDFLGGSNLFKRVVAQGCVEVCGVRVEAPSFVEGSKVLVYLRASELDLVRTEAEVGLEQNRALVMVERLQPTGPALKLLVRAPGETEPVRIEVEARRGAELGLAVGQRYRLAVRRARIFEEGGLAPPRSGG